MPHSTTKTGKSKEMNPKISFFTYHLYKFKFDPPRTFMFDLKNLYLIYIVKLIDKLKLYCTSSFGSKCNTSFFNNSNSTYKKVGKTKVDGSIIGSYNNSKQFALVLCF